MLYVFPCYPYVGFSTYTYQFQLNTNDKHQTIPFKYCTFLHTNCTFHGSFTAALSSMIMLMSLFSSTIPMIIFCNCNLNIRIIQYHDQNNIFISQIIFFIKTQCRIIRKRNTDFFFLSPQLK